MSGLVYDNISIGSQLPSRRKGPLTKEWILRYANASGDMNPIHIDSAAAKGAGFDGPIAHGMLAMGFLGQMISDWAGIENIRRYRVRFKAVAGPGDILTSRGEVIKKYEREKEKIVECRLYVENQGGNVILDGSAAILCKE